jgi:hypothetical protein
MTFKPTTCCENYNGNTHLVLTPNTPQYGKLLCDYCNRFVKFCKKPKNEKIIQIHQPIKKIDENGAEISEKTGKPKRRGACKCSKYNSELNEIDVTGKDGKIRRKGMCQTCGEFVKWIRADKVKINASQRQKEINKLISEGSSVLSEKKMLFLKSIYDRDYLTPRQKNYYDCIYDSIIAH